MASFSVPWPKSSSLSRRGLASPRHPQLKQSKILYSLGLNSRPSSLGFQFMNDCLGKAIEDEKGIQNFYKYKIWLSNQRQLAVWKVQAKLNEVVSEKSSNSALATSSQGSDESAEKASAQYVVPDESSISAFMTQVADLVKLVDSRDITELQLKQPDCELIIRKKEALPQPPAAPVFTMPTPLPHSMLPSQPPPAQATAPAPASPVPSGPPPALPAPAKTSKSSHPALKCPMAGTFYRSPAPSEPSFVKVGDKVQKGQVVCIIEAMKLMNEIEADQSGTITEILAEDGKPVSVDTPLFVISP